MYFIYDNFTQALLVMLVTFIMSARGGLGVSQFQQHKNLTSEEGVGVGAPSVVKFYI